MDALELQLKSHFCTAANDVTRLYMDSVKSTRRAQRVGRQEALEGVRHFVTEEAKRTGGVIRADALLYFLHQSLQELKDGGPGDPCATNSSAGAGLADGTAAGASAGVERKRLHEADDMESDGPKRPRPPAPELNFSFSRTVYPPAASSSRCGGRESSTDCHGFAFNPPAAHSGSGPFSFSQAQSAINDIADAGRPSPPPSNSPQPTMGSAGVPPVPAASPSFAPNGSISFSFSYSPSATS